MASLGRCQRGTLVCIRLVISMKAVTMSLSPVSTHIANISREAGLGVMEQILTIVSDREEVSDEALLALTSKDLVALYDGFVGPAVDRVERSLMPE